MQYVSPSKINLFLKVLGKRPDGYHEIATLMQAIDLSDIIHIEKSTGDSFICDDASLPIDGRNLIIKAREKFRQKTGNNTPLKIRLEKRVPFEAGLGGGSANAATALWGINQVLNAKVPEIDLQQWSAEIGSDVPFFFSHGTAYCTGRGEIVKDLPVHQADMWIVKPPVGISTVEVYRNFKSSDHFDHEKALENFSRKDNASIYHNDLATVAEHIAPELQKLKEALISQKFDVVQMSGSGSAYFCIGKDKPNVPNVRCYQVKSLNRKPGNWY